LHNITPNTCASSGTAEAVTDPSLRWFAVHTQPAREVGAAGQLGRQGFESFLPMHVKTVRHARRFRTVRAPVFPRYVFVRLDLGRHRWRSVNGTFGVSSLVMAGGLPAPVPRGVVEGLADLCGAGGLMSLEPGLEVGRRARVLAGPLAGLLGELTRVDEGGRVQILLDVLQARLSLDAQAVALSAA
jgi:transcription antitermination factor NusG